MINGVEARRAALVSGGTKLLLTLTILVAFLNPILRASEESVVTAFRVILPPVALLCFAFNSSWRTTRLFIAYLLVVVFYCLVQMLVFDLISDTYVLSYAINIVAATLFVYLICVYRNLYGEASLERLLYFWYIVIVLAAIHQLATGFTYPNAPFRDGVARIFFGQENDTSLAIAAFIPALLRRWRRDLIVPILVAAGIYIIYENSTRGVLVALSAYPLLALAIRVSAANRSRLAILTPIVGVVSICVVMAIAWLMRDVPIALIGDEDASIRTLILDPLGEIAAGEMMDAQLTSINVRVTLAVVGITQFLSTWGFGIGPGAILHYAVAYYPDIAGSMHIFPLELLTECGWLFVGTLVVVARSGVKRLGMQRFLPLFIFANIVTFSMNSGAITNYFFFACVCFLFTSGSPAVSGARAADTPPDRHDAPLTASA